mmetsp:Transcript_31954/g.48923  ORF Transcript_31954/g.48923 Transcript_31954/m.48923 type:complete len:100 (-) Transcript_31954:27-326(-)
MLHLADVWTSYLLFSVDPTQRFTHVSFNLTLDYYNFKEVLKTTDELQMKSVVKDINDTTLAGTMMIYKKSNGVMIAMISHCKMRLPEAFTKDRKKKASM